MSDVLSIVAHKNGVRIGRAFRAVADLKEAVAVWNAFRGTMIAEGLGSSDAPAVSAFVDGNQYRISWNGRVWAKDGAEVTA